MKKMKILVLGGSGAMGMVTVRDLVESPDVSEVAIGDFNLNQAKKVAKWTRSKKVSIQKVDITKRKSLVDAILNSDAVANAAPYHLNLLVTNAAIEAQRPLTDLGGVYYMTLEQLKLNKKAKEKNTLVVLGCGVAPGIADVAAKYGANKLDSVHNIKIRYGEVNLESVKYKWTFRTVLEEYTTGPVVYVKGKFKQLSPFSGKHVFKFPDPIGERSCCYALYSGLATLPKSIGKGVSDIDCAMSYTKEDEERISVLTEMGLTRKSPIKFNNIDVTPREFLIKCAPPPDVNIKDVAGIVVEVSGKKSGKSTKYIYSLVHRYHEKYGVSALAYLTGMPLSIAAQKLAKGKTFTSGVFPAETGIEPESFFTELSKRGVNILETCQTSQAL